MSHRVTEAQAHLLDQLAGAIFSTSGAPAAKRRQTLAQCTHTLRNHRFPGVDWPDLRQQLAGLGHKFLVHAMHREARLLERQVERVRRGFPEEELRNGLLAFLLAMTNSPVARLEAHADLPSDDEEDAAEAARRAGLAVEAATDWHALLMDGIQDLVRADYAAESDGAEGGDDGEESDASGHSADAASALNAAVPAAHPDPPWPQQPPGLEQQPQPPPIECHLSYLRARLQPEYWKASGGCGCECAGTRDRWGQLRLNWQQLLLRSGRSGADRVEVTQYQAVRETLWMLAGARDSTLYAWAAAADGSPTVAVAGRVCLPHLTDGALDRLLADFAALGTSVARLQRLSERLLLGGSRGSGPVMSALAGRLHADLLSPMRRSLLRLESESSLLRLRAALLPWQRAVAGAASLVSRAAWSDPEAAARDPAAAVRLLDCLERQAIRADLTESPIYATFARRAFRLCLRPLLEQLDGLLCGRPAAAAVSSGLPFLPDALPTEPPPDAAYWLAPLRVEERAVPRLLRPVMPDLASAIKSAHLVKAISERRGLPLLWRRVCQAGEAAPLHRLLDGQPSTVSKRESWCCPSPASMDEGPQTYRPALPDSDAGRLRAEAPLLWRSVQLLPAPLAASAAAAADAADADAALSSPAASVRSVQSAIRARCEDVNRLAVEALTGSDLRLLEFTRFVLDLFLMLNRDLLAPLCDLLYRELRAGQATCDELALNLSLRACLTQAPVAAQFANSAWLTLAQPAAAASGTEAGLALIESVCLNCEPPWPLGVVFTESALQVFSQSFRWLLKLRCAKELLERLRFDGLHCADDSGADSAALRYRVYGVRQQLLHLLTAFHQVTMHRLAAGAALPARLAGCSGGGPDELRLGVGQFADRCRQVCLLGELAAAAAASVRIRQTVAGLFRCAVVFARRWSLGQLTPAAVDSLQAQVDAGRQFFATFAATVARTGLADHIEPLLFAMS